MKWILLCGFLLSTLLLGFEYVLDNLIYMINEVIIDGIKYVAVDEKFKEEDFSCRDCEIYKARVPQNMKQLPLCCEDAYCQVNESCYEQDCNGIKRIWKKKD